jgi:hypothetical protein
MSEKKHYPLSLVVLAIVAGSVVSSVFAGCSDGSTQLSAFLDEVGDVL